MGWIEQWEDMRESQEAYCRMTPRQKRCAYYYLNRRLHNKFEHVRTLDIWTGEWIKRKLAKDLMDFLKIYLDLYIDATGDNVLIMPEMKCSDPDFVCGNVMSELGGIPIILDIITPTGNNITDLKRYTVLGGYTTWLFEKKELTEKGGYGTYWVFARWQDMGAYATFEIPPSEYYLKTENLSGFYTATTPDTEVFRAEDLFNDKPDTIIANYVSPVEAHIIPIIPIVGFQDAIVYEFEQPLDEHTHLLCGYPNLNNWIIMIGKYYTLYNPWIGTAGWFSYWELNHPISVYIP